MSLISANKLIDLNRLSQYDSKLKEHMLQEIANRVNAKTQSYVVDDPGKIVVSGGGTLPAQPTTDYNNVTSFTTTGGSPINYSNVHIGDVIFIKSTDAPDYWVSSINTLEQTFSISKLETQKVDLTGYATDARVTGVENKVTTLEQSISDFSGNLTDTANRVAAVETLAAKNKIDIESNDGDITALQGRCSTLENITIATGDEILALFN